MTLPWLRPAWEAPNRVHAAFTLRSGGVSAPPWNSLNLGRHVGDDPRAVALNRQRVAQGLALPAEPCWLEQLHGIEVYEVDAATKADAAPPPRADAAVTRQSGVVLAIQVADCLPVLLAAEDGSVLGAAHAGWRGLVGGVIEQTVATMGTPPERLVAWLGPCIGPERFEIGAEVREAFLGAGDAPEAFREGSAGRWLCDLPAIARARLQRLGVGRVAGGSWCTVADPAQFFSHRRDQLTGRMAAMLWREA